MNLVRLSVYCFTWTGGEQWPECCENDAAGCAAPDGSGGGEMPSSRVSGLISVPSLLR